jgi:phosphoglycolate phosphatase-like HAD superfamily hydrolase
MLGAVPYTALLLDLDHTLLDSDASETLAFERALARAGIADPGRVNFAPACREDVAEVVGEHRARSSVRVDRRRPSPAASSASTASKNRCSSSIAVSMNLRNSSLVLLMLRCREFSPERAS